MTEEELDGVIHFICKIKVFLRLLRRLKDGPVFGDLKKFPITRSENDLVRGAIDAGLVTYDEGLRRLGISETGREAWSKAEGLLVVFYGKKENR